MKEFSSRSVQCLTLTILLLVGSVAAQRLAIVEPDKVQRITGLSERLHESLRSDFRLLDRSMAEAAFASITIENPFNLTTEEARRVGAVIGSDVFVLLRSAVQHRESLDRPAYQEAYAAVYVVDSRTGRLIGWMLESVEGDTKDAAAAKLLGAVTTMTDKIANAVKMRNKTLGPKDPRFEEVPRENSPLAKGLRTPVPYRRIKPEYPSIAYLYSVKATIDIEVDIDADGDVARTSIERWAGFGLEKAAEKAVRLMNWRPAERGGKPLPMRVLLRYNFTKVEKDEAP